MARVQGQLFDSFEFGKGLRQGDKLSPVFFNFALESVIRKMPQQQRMEVNEIHTLLAYVNDIVIVGDKKQDIANSMFNLLKIGRHVVVNKLKKY